MPSLSPFSLRSVSSHVYVTAHHLRGRLVSIPSGSAKDTQSPPVTWDVVASNLSAATLTCLKPLCSNAKAVVSPIPPFYNDSTAVMRLVKET